MAHSHFPGTPMRRALAASIRAHVPPMLWGNPGQAKSATIEAMGRSRSVADGGYHVEVIIGSIREATDFLGLPIEVEGEVRYAPPAFAKRANAAPRSIVMFDEITTSEASTQKAMLRILQEGWVGDLRLEDSVSIVCAGNPPESAADGIDLAPPVANRLLHLNWEFDAESWFTGIVDGFDTVDALDPLTLTGKRTDGDAVRAAALVSGFVRARRDLLAPAVPTDPVEAGRAWPSPRSWHNAARVLGHVHPDDAETMMLVVGGCVGQGAAKEFITWMTQLDLENPDDVLNDPSSFDWAGARPDRLLALLTAIDALVRSRGDKATWIAAAAVLRACSEQGNRADVALATARKMLNRRPRGLDHLRAIEAFGPGYQDLLVETGRVRAA